MAETVIRFTPSARSSLQPGTRLDDRYELVRMIGAGGVGEVYLCHRIDTSEPVAIKMIKAELAGDKAIFALFRKEAAALQALNHDAIVGYFGFAIDRRLNRPYLAMEYVDGPSLSDRIKKASLSPHEADALRRRIALGLQAAHDKDITHRDVSPDNIILAGGDIASAKLIDFGIARNAGLGGGTTVIGDGFAGKYNYASPEQVGLFNGKVTTRSDIYSFGLVLAEALLGTPLDMSGSQADVVLKRQKLPDLSGVDDYLRPLITRMLQPDPKDRIGSMSEVAAWAADGGLPPGTRLDDIYELERMIGSGGMGEVYRSRVIKTSEPVAIKMIKPELAGDKAIFTLFRKEAAALQALNHEAIVSYFGFAVDRQLNRPYLVMEYADGPSLSDRIKKAPLSPQEADVLRQRIAPGLQMAHDKGIVHRDLSSDNIILVGENIASAKIIDFGIARTAGLGGHTTVIGDKFAGKYNYASPEQLGLFGSKVTNRSDIYSFGLVLAEALLGKPLDMSGSEAAVVLKRQKLPDLSGIDSRLRSLLTSMLQPDPEDRIGSMSEVAAWVERKPPPVAERKPAPVRQRKPLPVGRIAATAAAVLGVAGASAYVVLGRSSPAPPQVAAVAPPTRAVPAPKLDPTPPPAAVPPPAQSPQVASATAAPSSAPSTPAPPASAPSPSNPELAPAERLSRMYRYARYFDGGPCFYAWPGEFTDRKATVEAFSSSDQQIQRFEADFRLVNGIDPKVAASKLSAAQCPAIAFLQGLDSNPEGAARLELRQTIVRAGQRLQGELEGTGDRTVALLAIGDTGRVRVLSNARHDRGKTVIDQRLDDEDNSLPGSKLLIALAASRPFSSLASIPAGKAMAWDVLPALLEEATARKNDAVMTLAVPKLVRIEK